MKKQITLLLTAVLCAGLLCGCSSAAQNSSAPEDTAPQTTVNTNTQPDTAPQSTQAVSEKETEKKMQTIEILAGGQTFTAELNDSESAQALAARLPLTITMQELHGNEKYHYFSSTLPTDETRVGQIEAGDLMLYGSDCLVLFYESFSTPYSYTPLGKISDPDGLAAALGNGNVQVTFRAAS